MFEIKVQFSPNERECFGVKIDWWKGVVTGYGHTFREALESAHILAPNELRPLIEVMIDREVENDVVRPKGKG